jgi:hypothetical protein
MFDLMALAWQAELTRVSTMMVANELSNRAFPETGVNDGFHNCSHHMDIAENMRRLSLLNAYHVSNTLAYFVERLQATPDGDGTLLDHSLFLYGSNMGNSNQHDNYPLPEVLVGGANGKHVGGKNLILPERTPLANVHLTILDKLGIPQPSFGNSTGVLSDV